MPPAPDGTKEPLQQCLFPDIIFTDSKTSFEDEAMPDPDKLRRLPFSAAAEIWLLTRKPYLKDRSFINLVANVRALNKFLGESQPCKIHIGEVRRYVAARLANQDGRWKKRAGASIINHEVVTLMQVLERCGEWEKIKTYYEPLPMPRPNKPKVLTDAEELMFFAVAAQKPEWRLALCVAYITEMTGAAGQELRMLRHRDLFLTGPLPGIYINMETAKNVYRGRSIPLNSTALKYVQMCVERAHSLGSAAPEHFLFPLRDKTTHKWDPTRPASSSWLRRPWDGLRQATGLDWLTPHCLRHMHATISLEAGEPVASVAKRMGHSNSEMVQNRYGHLRDDTQKRAVAAIDPGVRFGARGAGSVDRSARAARA